MTTELKIDPELHALMPVVDRETKSILEESLKREGLKHPIEVWEKGKDLIIVDGHNRYELCKKLNIPVKVDKLKFQNKAAVKQHMFEVQLRRRNMTKEQASQFRAQFYIMKRGSAPKGTTTAQAAAKDLGVSEASVKRDVQFAEGLKHLKAHDADEAKKVEAGKSKINRGTIQKIGTAKTKEAREKVIEAAMKEAKREHRKVSDKPKAKPSNGEAKATTVMVETPEVERDYTKLVEKVSLYLTSKSYPGRKKMMKDIISVMGEIEDKEFDMPDEYADSKFSNEKEGTVAKPSASAMDSN